MYTITNSTNNDVTLGGGVTIPAQSSVNVTYYNKDFNLAVDAGLVTIAYTASAGAANLGLLASPAAMTDNSGGTAADIVAAVTDFPTAANAISTLVEKVNALSVENTKMKALLEDLIA